MAFIQGLLTIIFSFWMVLDHQGLVITTWFPIMVAFFMGLIMGDMVGLSKNGSNSPPNW